MKDYGAGKTALTSQQVVALDESSMVSNQKLHAFLNLLNTAKVRSILVGDTRQYSAIDAGKPFALLQQANIPTVHLTDITRQKDLVLQQAMQETYQQDLKKAFHTLEKNIIEIGNTIIKNQHIDDRSQRLQAICNDYLARTKEERTQTLVLTFGNEERVQLNQLIRTGLQQKNELQGPAVELSTLVPRVMTDSERGIATHYHTGDFIRFNTSDLTLGIKAGQYWQVKAVKSQQNCLLMEHQGFTTLWKPKATNSADPLNPANNTSSVGFEVYKPESRQLQAGDIIRWTRTDKTLGLISPELARVQKIQNATLIVQPIMLDNKGGLRLGEALSLQANHTNCRHWDHAYAMTGYSAQGKTVSAVIINAESYRSQLTSQPAFLVALTRAVDKLTIYTDDKKALLQALEDNAGQKHSAIQAIGGIEKVNSAVAKSRSRQEIIKEAEINL